MSTELPQLEPDEPLSPELVLVLPPELRAQALERLGPPVWPAPPPRAVEAPAPAEQPFAPSLGHLLAARVLQLALIFVAVTLVTLSMSLVAHAIRGPATRPIEPAGRSGLSSRSELRMQAYREGVWKPA